jgi:hypothetical protein
MSLKKHRKPSHHSKSTHRPALRLVLLRDKPWQ